MAELVVGSLGVRILGAGGSSHRIEAIALRAVDLLEQRLDELDAPSGTASGGSTAIDLSMQTDDEVAAVIAGAWLDALAVKMRG